MKNLSVKKLSLLGLVLVAASAVTAAIVPNKANDDQANLDQRGSITQSTGNTKQTCEVETGANNCNVTAVSGTTGGVDASSDGAASSSTLLD